MKRFLLLIMMIASAFITFAQADPAQKEQRVKALYVAYITQELKLTEAEAQKFWPVHSEYDNEVRSINVSSPELERQQNVLNIKKKYQEKFSRVIGGDRTNEFYKKDAEFRKRLVDRLQKMRQNKKGGNRRISD